MGRPPGPRSTKPTIGEYRARVVEHVEWMNSVIGRWFNGVPPRLRAEMIGKRARLEDLSIRDGLIGQRFRRTRIRRQP